MQILKSPPREYRTLKLVVELVYPNDPESYANGSLLLVGSPLLDRSKGMGQTNNYSRRGSQWQQWQRKRPSVCQYMAEEDPVGQTRLLAEVKAAGLGYRNSNKITWPSRLGQSPMQGYKMIQRQNCGLGQDRPTSGQHSQWLCKDRTEWRKWIERG